MRQNALIEIKGIQYYDSDNEVVELTTVGSFYRRSGAYYISYDESEATGFEGSRTTLKIEDNSRVTMLRTGSSQSQLIIEKGTRHQCQYDTGYGPLIMGVSADKIVTALSDKGGSLNFKYTLDFNASMASQNEVFVSVQRKDAAQRAVAPVQEATAPVAPAVPTTSRVRPIRRSPRHSGEVSED